MDSPDYTQLYAQTSTDSPACYHYTHAYRIPTHPITHTHTHTICTWKYHETLLTKMVLQIDSHGQREHLELISLLCFDKSFSVDFRLTIQTQETHLSSFHSRC